MDACCEFSRKIYVYQIQKKKFETEIEANEEEKEALTKRFSIPKILSLVCFYKLSYFYKGHIRAQGLIKASIIHNCVISLEDFPVEIEENFELIFIPAFQISQELEGLDDPDVISYENDYIDIGEVTAQQFALILDPYPHKPNIDNDLILKEEDLDIINITSKRDNPFKILEKLKKV